MDIHAIVTDKRFLAGLAIGASGGTGFGVAAANGPALAVWCADTAFDLLLKVPGVEGRIKANQDKVLALLEWMDKFSNNVEAQLKKRVLALCAPTPAPAAQAPAPQPLSAESPKQEAQP